MAEKPSTTGQPGSLTRSAVHGVFWITATRFVKVPLNLVALAVLARLLTPADFGIVAVGMIVATLSDVLVDGSFGMLLVQRRTIDPPLIGASLLLSVALAGISAAAVILGAPFIGQQFDFPHLESVLLVLAAVLPVTAVTTITTALLQRSFKFAALTLNAFVSQLGYTLVAISLALAGMGVWALVWAQVVSFVIQALMGLFVANRLYRIGLSASAVRDAFASGGMFTISKLLAWASVSADRLIIARFLGPSELGFYTRAANLMATARQLTGTGPLRVLFASFSKIQHDKVRMRKGYLRALSVSLISAALVSAFVIVNSEIIVRILLGPQWLPTIPLMQILFFAFLPRSGYIVAEAIPLSLGLGGASALRQGAQLVLVSAGAAIGVQFGVVGAAVGVCAGYWLFYFVCLKLVQQLIRPDWRGLLRVHVNSAVMVIPPTGLALAARWLLPADNILIDMVPAAVFGLAALIMILVAPATLTGEDIARARTHLWDKLSPHLLRARR